MKTFLSQFSMSSLNLGHPTYHHFIGEGASDSQLDMLSLVLLPTLKNGKESPLITSHHNLILSSFKSSKIPYNPPPQALHAQRVPNVRVKVCWESGEALERYKSLLSSSLPLLQESLCSPLYEALVSVLLKCTNLTLNRAAEMPFRTIKLSEQVNPKDVVDRSIKKAQKKHCRQPGF